MRGLLVAFTVVAALAATPGETAQVTSRGGMNIRVADAAAGPLQCVVNALEAQGYLARFGRGYGHGTVRGSLHPAGMAMDINQTARGRTTPRMPSNEIQIAQSCGVISGAVWANNDSGHFQVGGWGGSGRAHHRHRRHHRR